ncbi:hypothetical protein DM860_001417 [Cuscuta australis]|uniref:Uncharacterized protein n=1 Tax=Cuscuta australis TaxID=267555 RepID=A0A328ECI8_9ASTE|nr:hypothetical protein DM860_001417 [Cuscuta australis]
MLRNVVGFVVNGLILVGLSQRSWWPKNCFVRSWRAAPPPLAVRRAVVRQKFRPVNPSVRPSGSSVRPADPSVCSSDIADLPVQQISSKQICSSSRIIRPRLLAASQLCSSVPTQQIHPLNLLLKKLDLRRNNKANTSEVTTFALRRYTVLSLFSGRGVSRGSSGGTPAVRGAGTPTGGAHAVGGGPSMNSSPLGLTSDQFSRLLSMLDTSSTEKAAGGSTGESSSREWLIDSGASHHMTERGAASSQRRGAAENGKGTKKKENGAEPKNKVQRRPGAAATFLARLRLLIFLQF